MASEGRETPIEEAFLPTDFRQFVDSEQGANAVGNLFLKSMEPSQDPDFFSFTTNVESAKRGIKIVEALLRERRNLNAHYGWILASDAALVYKSMGGKSDQGAEWARQWIKGLYDEYERVGRALLDAKLELEKLVRRAESE